VTAAAHALNYAQPSISHHIARLEAETGAKLMERAGRGVKLTEVGRLLAERAEEILGQLDAAEAELAVHMGLRQGRVRVAAFGSALSTLVAASAAKLRQDKADVGLHLIQADPAQALRILKAGETDIALVYRYVRDGSQPSSLLAEGKGSSEPDRWSGPLLLDEPMYLLAPLPASRREPADGRYGPATEAAPGESAAAEAAAAEAAAGEAGSDDTAAGDREARASILAAYADRRWIGTEEQCGDFLLDLCHDAGFWPELAIRAAGFVAAQALVAAGLGVTIVPGLALRAARHPEVSATELPGARRHVLAVTYPASPDAPAAARLIEAMIRAAGA
jgi:DNA-binding transcriptional LysR family regulator